MARGDETARSLSAQDIAASNYDTLLGADPKSIEEAAEAVKNFYKAIQEGLSRELTVEQKLTEIRKLQKKLENDSSKNHEQELKRLKEKTKELELQEKVLKRTEKYQGSKDRVGERDAMKRARQDNSDFVAKVLKSGNITDKVSVLVDTVKGGLDNIVSTMADLSKKLDKTIEEIVSYKSSWDTRLFGSDSNYSSITEAITKSVGASPFVKQADVLKNAEKAVNSGIAYNVEQRAFLETIKDKIATTFDAFDSQLLQIVRVQQSDSTAARLGMEASLNAYLNSMYSNTEYLNGLSDSVTSALYEATSLKSASESIGFEYQVQKWLGSLYSVGMSQGSISSIATALGQLASGNVAGTTTDAGKLLVMAASRAGLDYSQLLTDGINDSQMNILLQSMVTYLEEIASSNKVVQAQYAKIYGLTTSDIVAAGNLIGSIADISKSSLTAGGALGMLSSMATSIGGRMSMGELINNAIENLQFSTASGIASNPVLYAMWAVSNFLEDYMGGIAIPAISAMGSGVDLETTVADLLRVGSLSGGLLSGIGSIITAANDVFGGQGVSGIISRLGGYTSLANSVTRGTGFGTTTTTTTSGMNYTTNQSGSDVTDATNAMVSDKKNEVAAQDETETDDTTLGDVNSSIQIIIGYLDDVFNGTRRLQVTTATEEISGAFGGV